MQQFTVNEQLFLKLIKKPCIEAGLDNNILPSIIAVLAITTSSWGTGVHNGLTNNLFNLTVNDEWYGKCYSRDTQKIYNTKADCNEIGAILYRVYDNYDQSINDWAKYIVTERRSSGGALKYSKLTECLDYKEALSILMRNGFKRGNEDPVYINNLIKIIEKYKLYDWDDSLKIKKTEETDVSKKYRKTISITTPNSNSQKQVENDTQEQLMGVEAPVEEVAEEVEDQVEEASYINQEETVYGFKMKASDPVYRVRLDWERPDTQIFASQNSNDAVDEAKKHEGYIVFVGDDGEIFCDPWAKEEEIIEEDLNAVKTKTITVPTAGTRVVLDKTPVYKLATDNKPFMYLSGENFYFYNNDVVNGRARITKYRYSKNPAQILGFIVVEE